MNITGFGNENPDDARLNAIFESFDASPNQLTIRERIQLCRQCLLKMISVSQRWGQLAAISKGFPADSEMRAEDVLSGPCVIARQLLLTIQSLSAIADVGHPQLPGNVWSTPDGQLCVPVFPPKGLFDRLTFAGLRGEVRMQPGVTEADLHGDIPERIKRERISGTTLVLGAGNVSSIPATDTLNRIMFDGRRVLLKLNPVNDYLRDLLTVAFQPLTDRGLLGLVSGGADVGRQLIADSRIDDVHITGSLQTYNAIVWGSDDDTLKRKSNREPLLDKQITSELGNVTPWVVVPGRYTRRELHSQAEHVAASITNNASFNCLATRIIITSRDWAQRDEFLRLVRQFLKATPVRPAYYPGALDRFQRYTRSTETLCAEKGLPWTLLEDQVHHERPDLFEEESFVCVCAETCIAAGSPTNFLSAATDFVNDRIFGTLCGSVTVPAGFRRQYPAALERTIARLRLGTVCINQWAGPAYGLISPPWGAYPISSGDHVQSGTGSVHNTYLLHNFEKSVLYGPLVDPLRPVWFPSHRSRLKVANALLRLYERPSYFRLSRLALAATVGL